MNTRVILAGLGIIALLMAIAVFAIIFLNAAPMTYHEVGINPVDSSAMRYMTPVAPGELAPDFAAASIDGQTIQLSQYHGQPLLLHFFQETAYRNNSVSYADDLPRLQAVYERYWSQGLAVVGICLDRNQSQLNKVLSRQGITFPIIMDSRFDTITQFRYHPVPFTLFITKDGKVLRAIGGRVGDDEYEEGVQALFADAAGPGLFSFLAKPTLEVGIQPGQVAPDFTLPTADNRVIRLKDLRGKPVLLYFYWVNYELPRTRSGSYTITDLRNLLTVQAIYNRHWAEGLWVVGVDRGEPPGLALTAIQKSGITFPVAIDQNHDVFTRYNEVDSSSAFFIAPDGTIRGVIRGVTLENQFEIGVQALYKYMADHPLPKPTATPRLKGKRLEGCVNIGMVSVRAAPSDSADLATQMSYGDCAPFDARSADGAWLRLSGDSPAGEGWIRAEYITLQGSLEDLPALR